MSRDPLPENGPDIFYPIPDMRKYWNPFAQPYVYARNNPVNLVDPSGLCGCDVKDPPGIQVTKGPMQGEFYPNHLDGYFGRTFKTHVEFNGECRCCEYRQFVKGIGTRARFVAPGARWQYGENGWGFNPPPNANVWREDCAGTIWIITLPLADCYGLRSQPELGGGDTYSQPDRLTGCTYDAEDTPGQPGINQFRQAAPNFALEVEMSYNFRLVIYDFCRKDANGQPTEVAREEFGFVAKRSFPRLN